MGDFYYKKTVNNGFLINKGIKRALAIAMSWCADKEETRQKSQDRLKSDQGASFLVLEPEK